MLVTISVTHVFSVMIYDVCMCVQVPNDLLVEVKGTVGGCSAISISRDGRWLAAACGDDKGRFKVGHVVYHNMQSM
jgi:hypothetical protein